MRDDHASLFLYPKRCVDVFLFLTADCLRKVKANAASIEVAFHIEHSHNLQDPPLLSVSGDQASLGPPGVHVKQNPPNTGV
jgi:hypothetical protein